MILELVLVLILALVPVPALVPVLILVLVLAMVLIVALVLVSVLVATCVIPLPAAVKEVSWCVSAASKPSLGLSGCLGLVEERAPMMEGC